MRGHLLGYLQPAAILEIRRNAGGAESVTTYLGLDVLLSELFGVVFQRYLA
jgi:hypothetical protein